MFKINGEKHLDTGTPFCRQLARWEVVWYFWRVVFLDTVVNHHQQTQEKNELSFLFSYENTLFVDYIVAELLVLKSPFEIF